MGLVSKFVEVNRRYSRQLEIKFPQFFGYPSYQDELLGRISNAIDSGKVKSVLEAGGIDRPLIKKDARYTYDGLDIESRSDCYEIYDGFTVQSIEEPLGKTYDLIISITQLEHVPDNSASMQNIYQALKENGETHHYVPSKWHPYSIALRLVGPTVQKYLIPILRHGSEAVTGYPAFFDYCSAPAMEKLMIENNFVDVNTRTFYRANDYFAFFTPAFVLVTLFENICKSLNWEVFASGFIISAKK